MITSVASGAARASLRSLAISRNAQLHSSQTTPTQLLIRRYVSAGPIRTPPAQRPRSLRSSAARWGLAIGAIWFYSTSDYFRTDPAYVIAGGAPPDASPPMPTLEELAEQRRIRRQQQAQLEVPEVLDAPSPSGPVHLSRAASVAALNDSSAIAAATEAEGASPAIETQAASRIREIPDPADAAALEEEASSEGAFNEETGEINWDCPCLGGMAYGPCGEEFREAFSCFVYSKEEPKGVDCIDRFKGMQDCFRRHPDVYGAELTDDLEHEDEHEQEGIESGSPAPAPTPAAARESTPLGGDASAMEMSGVSAQREEAPSTPAISSPARPTAKAPSESSSTPAT